MDSYPFLLSLERVIVVLRIGHLGYIITVLDQAYKEKIIEGGNPPLFIFPENNRR